MRNSSAFVLANKIYLRQLIGSHSFKTPRIHHGRAFGIGPAPVLGSSKIERTPELKAFWNTTCTCTVMFEIGPKQTATLWDIADSWAITLKSNKVGPVKSEMRICLMMAVAVKEKSNVSSPRSWIFCMFAL